MVLFLIIRFFHVSQIYVYALRIVFNQRQLLFFLRTFTRNIWESWHFQGHDVIYYKILQIMHILTLLNFELLIKKKLCSLSGYIVRTMWPSTDLRDPSFDFFTDTFWKVFRRCSIAFILVKSVVKMKCACFDLACGTLTANCLVHQLQLCYNGCGLSTIHQQHHVYKLHKKSFPNNVWAIWSGSTQHWF